LYDIIRDKKIGFLITLFCSLFSLSWKKSDDDTFFLSERGIKLKERARERERQIQVSAGFSRFQHPVEEHKKKNKSIFCKVCFFWRSPQTSKKMEKNIRVRREKACA